MFHSNLYSYRHQSGFTLVEMVVVVAIIAIVSSIAYPSMQSQIAKARVIQATGDIESALKEARAEALITKTNITVKLDGNQGLLFSGVNNITIPKPVKTPKNVTITPLPGTPTSIVFTPYKTVKGSGSANLGNNSGFVICHEHSKTVKSVMIGPTANIIVVANRGSCA